MPQVTLLPPAGWRGHGDATVSLEQRAARQTLVDQLATSWLPWAVQRSALATGYVNCPDALVNVGEHAHGGEHRVIHELRVEINFTCTPESQQVNPFRWAFLGELFERFKLKLPLFEGHGLALLPLCIACEGATFGRAARSAYINMVTGCARDQPSAGC